jgi:hypothetical protein
VFVVIAALGLAISLALMLRFGSRAGGGQPATAARDQTRSTGVTVQYPTSAAVRAAESFARERRGRVSFAVVDTSGAIACYRCRERYEAASVVKAMLLVSYLNRLGRSGEPLPADHEAFLASMIRVSDNDAATAIYAHVGDEGLTELAAEAQMTGFRVSGGWGSAQINAADQARFFAALDELTAAEYRDYSRALLTSIAPEQSWGIPEVARPEWQTFFKGGWLTHGNGSLVHQVARLEQGERTMALAVLTDGNPTDEYGRETIQSIAARLLNQ